MSVSGRHLPSDLDVIVNDEIHTGGSVVVVREEFDPWRKLSSREVDPTRTDIETGSPE